MIVAVTSLGGVALAAAVALGIAAKKFAVEVDPREVAVMDALPGANCGGCGYPGCSGFAKAVVEGAAPVTGCPPGGGAVAADIASILGVTAVETEKMVAMVKCQGDNAKAKDKFHYLGIHDCRTAQQLAGGPKQCPGGCVGLGTCAKVCPFDAIEITEQGLAVVNREKCTGCQKCIPACPRSVISLAPYGATVHVLCNSHDKGPVVKKYCEVGCIGCTLCKKAVPDAYAIEKFLAHVVYDQREGSEAAVEKCPTKCIRDLGTQGYPEGSSFTMPAANA